MPKKSSLKKSQETEVETQSEVISILMDLKSEIKNITTRLNFIEGQLPKEGLIPFNYNKEESKNSYQEQFPQRELDENLKTVFNALEQEHRPITATELAEKINRSRSTTSHHLNRLVDLSLADKNPGREKGQNSRSIYFNTKDSYSK